jgi:hypothetical protein
MDTRKRGIARKIRSSRKKDSTKGKSAQTKLVKSHAAKKKAPKPEIQFEEARKYLSNVRPENSFWINNGPIINNLKHLPKAVEEIDETTFVHHVNSEKNDFSSWIQDCIGDMKLAQDLRKIRTKEEFLKKLKNRVTYLKKIVYVEV